MVIFKDISLNSIYFCIWLMLKQRKDYFSFSETLFPTAATASGLRPSNFRLTIPIFFCGGIFLIIAYLVKIRDINHLWERIVTNVSAVPDILVRNCEARAWSLFRYVQATYGVHIKVYQTQKNCKIILCFTIHNHIPKSKVSLFISLTSK